MFYLRGFNLPLILGHQGDCQEPPKSKCTTVSANFTNKNKSKNSPLTKIKWHDFMFLFKLFNQLTVVTENNIVRELMRVKHRALGRI